MVTKLMVYIIIYSVIVRNECIHLRPYAKSINNAFIADAPPSKFI